jgi:hypothetical protein
MEDKTPNTHYRDSNTGQYLTPKEYAPYRAMLSRIMDKNIDVFVRLKDK